MAVPEKGRVSPAKGQCKNHLAKAGIVEIFSDDQRLWEAHQHTFEPLQIGHSTDRSRNRKVDFGWDHYVGRAAILDCERTTQLSLPTELARSASHLNNLPRADAVVIAVKDKDAVRAIGVAITCVLQVETAMAGAGPSKSPMTVPCTVTVPLIALVLPVPWTAPMAISVAKQAGARVLKSR